ncbi:hypothetical protein RFI_39355, partial [Reticulomyxa filosa]
QLVDKCPKIASRYQYIVPANETIHYWGSIVKTRCQKSSSQILCLSFVFKQEQRKFVLCSGQHPECEVIRKAREKLGIKLTRKKDASLKKKQIAIMSQSNKSPFATSDQIMVSLDDDCIVIFCDGSTYPNSGIRGAGLVIQDSSMPKCLELEYSINGITTNIGSEIEAMRLALKH